jgi:TRAP-type C4-dicarboxylate transport system substrate-binding protein
MRRLLVLIATAALATTLATGCGLGSGSDKAGGSRTPVVLRLAVSTPVDDPDVAIARLFAARVAAASHGSLRIQLVVGPAGLQDEDPEERVARMVRDGRFDLGWIGSRAWDELGITSFQALQAPFLVTSYPLIGRIATSSVAARMLDGLRAHGFVGLALVPDRLRHPFGVARPFRSPRDFAGARIRVIPSRATDMLMRALGATPVHISGSEIDAATARRAFDGTEHELGTTWPGGHYLTANVTYFPKMVTLFAGTDRFNRLSDSQRAIVRKAAEQTAADVAANPPVEDELARRYCQVGRVFAASRGDLAALTRAARPVYAQLERDHQTRALIAAIRELKATTPAPAPPQPVSCVKQSPAPQGRRASPSMLNGTYRWRRTKAGAIAAGHPNDPDIGTTGGMTLRDGKWRLQGGSLGTYEVIGDLIVFDWPQQAQTLQFTFKRHDNGDLELKPVLPMDPGDRFVWAAETWRRVGPPIAPTP